MISKDACPNQLFHNSKDALSLLLLSVAALLACSSTYSPFSRLPLARGSLVARFWMEKKESENKISMGESFFNLLIDKRFLVICATTSTSNS